jgi:hypothetical protein
MKVKIEAVKSGDIEGFPHNFVGMAIQGKEGVEEVFLLLPNPKPEREFIVKGLAQAIAAKMGWEVE